MGLIEWQKQIKELSEANEDRNKGADYFVSAYLANDGQGDDVFKNKVRAVITEAIKNDKRLNKDQKLKEELTWLINDFLSKPNGWSKGLGLFIKSGSKGNEKIKYSKIISLNRTPFEEIIIDKTFSIDQLIWMEATFIDASVLIVNDNNAQLCHISEDSIKVLREFSNDFGAEAKGRPGTLYGPTKDDFSKIETTVNRNFLNYIGNSLKNEEYVHNSRYLVIIYSNYFEEIIEKFRDDIKNEFMNLRQIKLINMIPVNIEEARKAAIDSIREGQDQVKVQNLLTAKENFRRFVTGWQNVCQAIRRKQVEKMFIRANLKRSGYVLKGEFVYVKKTEGTERVRNIGPWMVNNVIKNGGDVFIFNQEDGRETIKNVAALLRY